ncbi:MAG: DUF3126 family protein [Candidatus Puniceispirillaceae bacterium]
MERADIDRLERYLKTRFDNQDIKLIHRPQTGDSAEFEIDGETLGIVYRDDEDGETCYHVQLTILAEDLS